MTRRQWTGAFCVWLGGVILGAGVSILLFVPTKPAVDMLKLSAIRYGWLCRDAGISYDECALSQEGSDH